MTRQPAMPLREVTGAGPSFLAAVSGPMPYGYGALPAGIRSRTLEGINGLQMHVLEAGFETPNRPSVLLVHGFPELAYSWRHVMQPLAAAGFHVLAPDRRGYGRTTGWAAGYEVDLRSFGVLNGVADLQALVSALQARVAAVIGHDYGAPLAAWCALLRPDVFPAVVMLSSPFTGPPATASSNTAAARQLDESLAALPRPRKHYLHYYTLREANADLWFAPQGLRNFLRAYFHCKSADWHGNRPFPLRAATAAEFAQLPPYYVMDRAAGMAATVAPHLPTAAQIAGNHWLTEADLDVYAAEYTRTGFQGGLNEYRCDADATLNAELQGFGGRTIDVPALFIAGSSDWGAYQTPGALEAMGAQACTRFAGIELIEGAGHWVQQEQPGRVVDALRRFLAGQAVAR